MAETTVKKFLDYAGLQHIIEKLYARGFNGMGLSKNDFTDALLTKLNSTATSEGMSEINSRLEALEKLIDSDKDGVINKFNEIVAFLNGIADTDTLGGILAAKANSADVYTKTDADKTFAKKATTLSDYGITDAKISGGTITLGSSTITPLTQHQDISGKVDKVTGKGLSTNDYTTAEKNLVATIGDKLNSADVAAITSTEIDAIITGA